MKPKSRSRLRIVLGAAFFTLHRYLHWYFGKNKYAKTQAKDLLPRDIIEHKTPLLRKLTDVNKRLIKGLSPFLFKIVQESVHNPLGCILAKIIGAHQGFFMGIGKKGQLQQGGRHGGLPDYQEAGILY